MAGRAHRGRTSLSSNGTVVIDTRIGLGTESRPRNVKRCFWWRALPLFVVFTVRAGKVRVISARMATVEEREDYDLLR